MHRALVLGLFAICSSCGGTTSAPTPVAATSPPEKKTKCPPGSDDMPKDARDKMSAMQGAVRKCYTLGIGGAETDVKIEVTVGQSGEVRDARVIGTSGHPTALDCLKKTMHGTKFAKFCGPDVSISWTYALR